MTKSYLKLFKIPGAIWFSMAGLFGRLPAGMIGFAVILPVVALTQSYALAGLVAAAAMLGMALFAPFTGRMVDRIGQAKVLYISVAINFVSMLSLILSIYFNVSIMVMCVAAFISGASRLSTGTLVRTRWAYVIKKVNITTREQMLQAAYAYEAIIDEVVFISAPILVIFLCTRVQVLSGLIACFLAYCIGGFVLARQSKTEPKVQKIADDQSSAWKSVPILRVISFAIFLVGMSAGSVEVIVLARASHLGLQSWVGILMAILAVGSMLAGFWYGAKLFRSSYSALWLRCMCLLVFVLVPFIFAVHLWFLAVSLFLAGLFIGPTAIAGQVLVKHIVPPHLLNEGMSVITTAMILGMAVGNWLAGVLIDKYGILYVGLLPFFAVCIACLFSFFAVIHDKDQAE